MLLLQASSDDNTYCPTEDALQPGAFLPRDTFFFTVERIDMVVAYGRRRYVSAATSVEPVPDLHFVRVRIRSISASCTVCAFIRSGDR